MKRWQAFLIGIVIGAVTLFLAFRQANFAEIGAIFASARYEYVALSFALVIVTIGVRGLRWSVLTERRLSIADGFWLFNIGFLFNNVLPARLGEAVRAMLAGRRERMHISSALSSMVVERLFDMISVTALFAIAILGLDLPPWATNAGFGIGIGGLAGLVILAIAARYPDVALRIGVAVLSIIPRVSKEQASDFLSPFVEGLGAVSSPVVFVLGFLLSILAWLMSAVAAWVLLFAFVTNPPPIHGVLAVGAAGLGIAVPGPPSGLGPFEAAVIGVLVAIDYTPDVSRSYAVALHAVNFLTTSSLGLIGLLREGKGFFSLMREAQESQEGQKVDSSGLAEAPPT
jgi:uncharacterized protein (TIRG00374 family)